MRLVSCLPDFKLFLGYCSAYFGWEFAFGSEGETVLESGGVTARGNLAAFTLLLEKSENESKPLDAWKRAKIFEIVMFGVCSFTPSNFIGVPSRYLIAQRMRHNSDAKVKVLELYLEKNRFLCGEFSIADIFWLALVESYQLDLSRSGPVEKWRAAVAAELAESKT